MMILKMKFNYLFYIIFIFFSINQYAADDFADFAQIDAETCYFSIEFQGIYMLQSQVLKSSSKVAYSEITIETDGITPWGRCFKRKGNQLILKDTNEILNCIRCFHLTLKSPNVIQIQTESLAKCYTREEAARATCPSEKDIREKRYKEYTLFRKHVPGGLQTTENVFCPINGRYHFKYTTNGLTHECKHVSSELSNCPHGNALGMRFGQCNNSMSDIRFLCLGSWDHYDSNSNDRYLALMDMNEDPQDRPKYRCGMYRKDSETGIINIALSSDSTCTTMLHNSSYGQTTLVLNPINHKNKLATLNDNYKCKFPEWSHGKWGLTHLEGSIFKFKDSKHHFRKINSRCLMRYQVNGKSSKEDRFIIHSVTQCGEEMYQCLWLKIRSTNIMEFMIGKQFGRVLNNHLCDDYQFENQTWITQGRKTSKHTTGCPIVGDYLGVVPGESSLCAKIASDCNNPDIMFYTVSLCQNRSHVFEQREYRCFGSWEEDGSLLTFTQRRDMSGYQCFRGNIKRNGDEAFIAEAGESCIRGHDPSINEMKIIKQASCPRSSITPYVSVLSWDSRAIDKVHISPVKRIHSNIIGGHKEQMNNNLPIFNKYYFNNDQLQLTNNNQLSNNVHNNLFNTNNLNEQRSNQQFFSLNLPNTPNIVKDFYQAEKPIIKQRIVSSKRPPRVPQTIHNPASSLMCVNTKFINIITLILYWYLNYYLPLNLNLF